MPRSKRRRELVSIPLLGHHRTPGSGSRPHQGQHRGPAAPRGARAQRTTGSGRRRVRTTERSLRQGSGRGSARCGDGGASFSGARPRGAGRRRPQRRASQRLTRSPRSSQAVRCEEVCAPSCKAAPQLRAPRAAEAQGRAPAAPRPLRTKRQALGGDSWSHSDKPSAAAAAEEAAAARADTPASWALSPAPGAAGRAGAAPVRGELSASVQPRGSAAPPPLVLGGHAASLTQY